jgi:hypothetical protein
MIRTVFSTLITVFVTLLPGTLVFGQTCIWSKQIGRGLPITKMVDGNLLMHSNAITGYVNYPFCTIEKFSHSGRPIWAMQLPKNIAVICMTPSPDSGFYAAGVYDGVFDWNGHQLDSGADQSSWFARFNKEGTMLWARGAFGQGGSYPSDMSFHDGFIYVTGGMGGTLSFNDTSITSLYGGATFVAAYDEEGRLKAINSTVGSKGFQFTSTSGGRECDVDDQGNVYVLSVSLGLTSIDTFQIGHWNYVDGEPPFWYSVIKFDRYLKAQLITLEKVCYSYCSEVFELNVSGSGSCYVIEKYDEAIPGHAGHWTKIIGIAPDGKTIRTYVPPGSDTFLFNDLDLDACDNVYFTGNLVRSSGDQCLSLLAGRMSPDFKTDWYYENYDCNNWSWGRFVSAFDDHCLVSGAFNDSIQLSDLHVSQNNSGIFLCRMEGHFATPCDRSTAINEIGGKVRSASVFPNPARSVVLIKTETDFISARLFSSNGVMLLNSDRPQMEVSPLPAGIYFVEVEAVSGKSFFKMVVEH